MIDKQRYNLSGIKTWDRDVVSEKKSKKIYSEIEVVAKKLAEEVLHLA